MSERSGYGRALWVWKSALGMEERSGPRQGRVIVDTRHLALQFFPEIERGKKITRGLYMTPPIFYASVNFWKKLNGELPYNRICLPESRALTSRRLSQSPELWGRRGRMGRPRTRCGYLEYLTV